jgi:hypothetical protein
LRVEKRHWCHQIGLDYLFQNTPSINPLNNDPSSHGMHLKMQLLSRGLKLSYPDPSCRVPALHFFANKMSPVSFRQRAQSDECFVQLFIPGLIPVSRLESASGFGIVTQVADTGNDHLHISSLWCSCQSCANDVFLV